ncbi:MAG: aminodeoxychorismate lyase [Gammaproteobacteria bacterium]|nr:aminodeoxychorismate lyase [Gammaproteobacteria bacterium]
MNTTGKHNLINGIAADYIDINDRAIHYGDGLFETILCRDNSLFYWHQHYQRLLSSCKKIKIHCPDEQLLLRDIKTLLAKNKNSANNNRAVKIIITRGSGERGYIISGSMAPARLVFLSYIAAEYSSLLSGRLLSGELYLCRQQVSINESLAGLKHLNRLENVMARNEWGDKARHGDDAHTIADGLMQNADQYVIEGTMSNLFAVKGNQLFTPDLAQSGIKGVMRDVIIDIANKMGIVVKVDRLRVEELLAMDELFITNSLIGIKSINRFKHKQYNRSDVTKVIFETLLGTKDDYVQTV